MAEAADFFGPPMPVFRVADMDASVAYYTQVLGFEVRFRSSEDFAKRSTRALLDLLDQR